LAEAFRRGYERWFEDVGSTRGYAPPRIHLGTPHENPAVLTRQDWRGPKAGLRRESVGFWEVDCAPGRYDISLLFPAAKERGVIHFKFGTMEMEQAVEPQSERVLLPGISLPGGPGRMEGWLTEGSKISGAQYLEITRLDP
ncbi:hypothetical protein HY256_09260, partial [Candidatus Sumerlaeota bacterium]|nr:hypothetical protein [Candidatus Sumerlaeota bacterium]